MNASQATAMVLVVGLSAGTATAVVTIETVPVGNPGNAADTRYTGSPYYNPPIGAVGYTYNIGKYEVTGGEYCEFLNKVAATDTYRLYNTNMANTQTGSGISRNGSSGSYTYTVNSAFVNRPVNYVSYWDACRFTNWLSNGQPTGAQGASTTERGTYTLDGYNGSDGRMIQRNPGSTWAVTSEDEWYKAAYYKGGSTNAGYWDYPTRSNTAPGRDLNDISRNNANYYGTPFPIQSPYYTTVVAEFQNSASPYGTLDQGGNVREWNETVIIVGSVPARCLLGGSFVLDGSLLRAPARGLNYPTFEDEGVGFRVVQVPEPTTLWFLLVGGLSAVLRRRK